jgi:hypothetical protein
VSELARRRRQLSRAAAIGVAACSLVVGSATVGHAIPIDYPPEDHEPTAPPAPPTGGSPSVPSTGSQPPEEQSGEVTVTVNADNTITIDLGDGTTVTYANTVDGWLSAQQQLEELSGRYTVTETEYSMTVTGFVGNNTLEMTVMNFHDTVAVIGTLSNVNTLSNTSVSVVVSFNEDTITTTTTTTVNGYFLNQTVEVVPIQSLPPIPMPLEPLDPVELPEQVPVPEPEVPAEAPADPAPADPAPAADPGGEGSPGGDGGGE